MTTPEKKTLKLLAPTATLLACLALYASVLALSAPIGFDLHDQAAYLIQIRHPLELEATLTHFGLVWNYAVGDHGIVINRYLNVISVLGAGAVLGTSIQSIAGPGLRRSVIIPATSLACMGAFHRGVLDPSYNSVSLACTILFLATLLRILGEGRPERDHRAVLFLAAIGGLFLIPILISKGTTALALALIAPTAVVAASPRGRHIVNLVRVGAGWTVGMLVFLVVFELVSGSSSHIWHSMSAGQQLYLESDTHGLEQSVLDFPLLLKNYIKYSFYCLKNAVFLIYPATVYLATDAASEYLRGGGQRSPRLIQVAMRWLPPVATASVTASLLLGRGASEGELWASLLTGFNLHLVFCLAALRHLRLEALRCTAVITLAAAPFALVFGSAFSLQGGLRSPGMMLALPAAFLASTLSPDGLGRWARRQLIASAAIMTALGSSLTALYPWAIEGNLLEAREEVAVTETDQLLLAANSARFCRAIRRHAFSGDLEKRPIVIDLTYRVQMAPILLGGRPPLAPWPVITPDNGAFTEVLLSRFTEEELSSCWFLAFSDDLDGARQAPPPLAAFLDRFGPDHASALDRFRLVERLDLEGRAIDLWAPSAAE